MPDNNIAQTQSNLAELSTLLATQLEQVKYNRIDTLYPDKGPYSRDKYPKHVEFMNKGAQFSIRAFIAANRTGKTLTVCTELAYHLTGRYPHWWRGKRFKNAISAWAAGITNQSTKEILQFELLGRPGQYGTGTIPKNCIIGNPTKKPGVADAVETVYVQHVSGDISDLTFKSYDQGRDSFQGTKKQVIVLDEEPRDRNIFTECLTRTMDDINPGIIICSFTPLFGLSDVVMSFLPDGQFPIGGVDEKNPHVFVTQVSWDDVPHLSEKQKQELLAQYSDFEREARTKGIPSLGAGAIYPYLEDYITVEEDFQIPPWWPRAYALDVGWNKTACVWGAMDPETRQVYLYSEHYESFAQPVVHALAIKARGEWLWGAIDPASMGVNQADGRALFDLYEECGLNLELANNSVEAGILTVGQMLASGQLKVFKSLRNWLREYRVYRRDENGKIIKKNDHLMDATRYLVMTGLDLMQTAPDPDLEEIRHYASNDKDPFTGY